jgi:transcriptional regulator with XRE-family HTH domain
MNLKTYLTKNMITFRAFAKKADIDSAQLARYANGANLPSLRNALKIYKATSQSVSLEDWFKPIKKRVVNGN